MARQQQFDLPKADLRRLMNMTPREFYERKAQCRIAAQQYGAGSRRDFQRSRPKFPIYYNEMRVSTICPSGQRRYSYVRFYGPPDPKTPVWVWCSCEHFAYTYEWVLSKIGCSAIATGYSDRGIDIVNAPPDIRNPQKRLGLCKHLLGAAEMALRQTKDFASEMGKRDAAAAAAATAALRARATVPTNFVPGKITTFQR